MNLTKDRLCQTVIRKSSTGHSDKSYACIMDSQAQKVKLVTWYLQRDSCSGTLLQQVKLVHSGVYVRQSGWFSHIASVSVVK